MPSLIYKICTREAWEAAQAAGRYQGSADGGRDGFIHLSTASQLAGTMAKHFAGQEGLVLVAVDADQLGDKLKWEPARSGELFPHLYGPLRLDAVIGFADLLEAAQGPDQIAKAAQRLQEAAQEPRETARGLAP